MAKFRDIDSGVEYVPASEWVAEQMRKNPRLEELKEPAKKPRASKAAPKAD